MPGLLGTWYCFPENPSPADDALLGTALPNSEPDAALRDTCQLS